MLYYEQYGFFFFLLLKIFRALRFDLAVSLRNSYFHVAWVELHSCNSSAKILKHVACCKFAVMDHFRGKGGLFTLIPQVLSWTLRHSHLQVVGSQSCLLAIAPISERSCSIYDAFCSLFGVSTAFSIQIFNFKSLSQFNTEPLMHL